MAKIIDILKFLLGIIFSIIVILTLSQVFFRFVLDSPLIWSEELARLLLVWMVMLGGVVLSFEDRHMVVDTLSTLVSLNSKFGLYIFRQVMVFIFLAVTVFTSIDLLIVSGASSSGALGIPFSYWRAAAPVGSLLMLIFGLTRFYRDIKEHRISKSSMTNDTKKG